jgi:uronate dehydrogenase
MLTESDPMSNRSPMLLTGAAGVLGRWLQPRLLELYGALRSTDATSFSTQSVEQQT